jgi:hypothetical protein
MQQMFGGELFLASRQPADAELFLHHIRARYCPSMKPEEIFPAGIMASVKI